jgi:hypothetical protein
LIIIFRFCLAITLAIGLNNKALAQIPKGVFVEDSMRLGEVINYTLVFKHDANIEVFFPDLNYNYAPFEYVDKIYFPTKTSQGVSTDSAIYQLRSFGIDSIQYLSLPVYNIQKGDSTAIFTAKDSLLLKTAIKGNATFLKLKAGAEFLPMKTKPNLWLIFAQIIGFAALIFIWWLFFGKIIKRQLNLFSIYRSHTEFSSTFNRYAKNANKVNIKKALILWKKYMSRLKNQPFITMTTPEILQNIPNDQLNDALREIDSSVYGSSISNEINEAIAILKKLADNEYNFSKKEIQ